MEKTQKGITLIALIITIVLLLILSVVTVGSVKENGIINRAQQAAKQSEIAQIKEAFELKNTQKLLVNKIDKNDNIQISSLDDLDISDNLKEKYRDKLIISGENLYYDPEFVTNNEEITYMEQQGITPNQSTFKIAVKNAVNNTTKTGDYYNLVTVMNKVKQDYPSAVGLVLVCDMNHHPTEPWSEELFELYLDSNYKESVIVLLKNGDEEIKVSTSGTVTDYNGDFVLMYDLDAMNMFGLKIKDSGELELISYKGTDPDVVVPAALYNDQGDITYGITKISEKAFEKNTTNQLEPTSILALADNMSAEDYGGISIEDLFSGLELTYSGTVDPTLTDNKDKLRALYESFLEGKISESANTTASLIYDNNFIPSVYMEDGGEFQEMKTSIDITSIKISTVTYIIDSNAFYNQKTLIKVICPADNIDKIAENAFAGCDELRGIYFVTDDEQITASKITSDSNFAKRWGAPEGTKIYLNNTPLN